MPQININDVSFHYEMFGEGETEIIFIPGYTGDINLWRSVAESLKTSSKALLFDPQGSGQTEDKSAPLSVEGMAKNIHQLYASLGFRNPVIVGFALGASIALSIAHQYPKDLSGLVLVAGVIRFNEHAKTLCENLCRCREIGTPEEFRKAASLLYDFGFGKKFKAAAPKDNFIDDFGRLLEGAQRPENQHRQLEALKKYDATPWVSDIKRTSSLVISPIEDQFSPPEDCNELATAIGAKLETVEDCGHAILLEQGDKVSSLIKSYLHTLHRVLKL